MNLKYKVMAKFKIIESGRLLTAEEMAKAEGGICLSPNIFRNCSSNGDRGACIGLVACYEEQICTDFFRFCTKEEKFTCNKPEGFRFITNDHLSLKL